MYIVCKNIRILQDKYHFSNSISRPIYEIDILIDAPETAITLDNCIKEIAMDYLLKRYNITLEEVLDAFPEKFI
jgi:replicative superfamily II helicase